MTDFASGIVGVEWTLKYRKGTGRSWLTAMDSRNLPSNPLSYVFTASTTNDFSSSDKWSDWELAVTAMDLAGNSYTREQSGTIPPP